MGNVWEPGSDVVLMVAGKYSLLGNTMGEQFEDGRVIVKWDDGTRTCIRGDLLVTPGDAAIAEAAANAESATLLAEVKELREVVRGGMHTSAKYYRKYGQALSERDRVARERDRARDLAARLEAELAIAEQALEVTAVAS